MVDGEDKPIEAKPVVPKPAKIKQALEEASNPYQLLSAEQKEQVFSFGKKLTIKGWVVANGVETCLWTKKVKLGTQEFIVGGKRYQILYHKLQKDKKGLVYNVQVNNELGALAFSAPTKDVDAKVAKNVGRRQNLNAIWGSWQMPLIIALIAIIAAIIGFSLMAVFIAQLGQANACLSDLNCMEGRQQAIILKAQEEANKDNPEGEPTQ